LYNGEKIIIFTYIVRHLCKLINILSINYLDTKGNHKRNIVNTCTTLL